MSVVDPMFVRLTLISFSAISIFGSDMFGGNARPDLGVIVTGSGSDGRPVTAPDQPFSFIIGLDNMNGTADSHHVKLSAILPEGLKFQSSEPPPTRVERENRPVWEIDTLPAKALPRLFQVTAETDTNVVAGSQVEISAAVESDERDANPADNHASYKVYIQDLGPALVFLGSTLDSVPVTGDGPATFKVNLINAGNLPAIDARMQATLPRGVKFDKADPPQALTTGQSVTFKLGDLAPAESKSVSMTVELDVLERSDLLSNDRPLNFAFQVSRMASGAEVVDSHFKIIKHVESVGQDVAIWLMTEDAKVPGEVSPKTDIACVIKFANLGNEPAHKVALALYLGSGLAMGPSTPQPTDTGTNKDFPGGVAHWEVGDLGIGMSRTIHSAIHATSIPDDGALITGTITADGFDTDATNNTASLVWHNASPLKSMRRLSTAMKSVGVPEKPTVHRVSHRWRYFFGLSLLIIAAFFFRARRGR